MKWKRIERVPLEEPAEDGNQAILSNINGMTIKIRDQFWDGQTVMWYLILFLFLFMLFCIITTVAKMNSGPRNQKKEE